MPLHANLDKPYHGQKYCSPCVLIRPRSDVHILRNKISESLLKLACVMNSRSSFLQPKHESYKVVSGTATGATKKYTHKSRFPNAMRYVEQHGQSAIEQVYAPLTCRSVSNNPTISNSISLGTEVA